MAHWSHSSVNYKSEPAISTTSAPYRYHYCSDESGALYLPALNRARTMYQTPFLCAFAPLRERGKIGSGGNFTGSFSQRRKGAKAQRRKGAKIAKQIQKRRWFLSEVDSD